MKDWKIILGTIMMILTFIIIYLNIRFTKSENPELVEPDIGNIGSISLFETLPIKVDSDFLDLELNESDSLISVIAILNTKVCASCVSNTLMFIDEVKKREEFTNEHNIIFIDEEEDEVDRFVQITRLDHPIKRINSEELDPFFQNKTKVFIFLNSSSEVFHYFPIPVAHSSLEAINYEINNTIELNKIDSKPTTNQSDK